MSDMDERNETMTDQTPPRLKALAILQEGYNQGSRVTNCVTHMNVDFEQRPEDCRLCRTDILNHMLLACRVNDFLNSKVDRAIEALS